MIRRILAFAVLATVAACGDTLTAPDQDLQLAPTPVMNLATSSSQVLVDGMGYHGCAFYPAQGNVFCWDHPMSPWLPGANHNSRPGRAYGQNEDYLGGDAVGFAVGSNATCVLKADGNTTCWGNDASVLTYSGGDAVDVAMGNGTACVLTSAGKVRCVGGSIVSPWNVYKDMNTGNDAQWIQMAAWSVCWGTSAGEVRCGGWNVTENPWPVEGTATPVGGGYYALCLLTQAGDVDCMKNNYNEVGQALGYWGGDAVHADAAFNRSCAATSAGNVECWGRGSNPGSPAFMRWTEFSNVDAVAVLVLHEEICYVNSSNQVNCRWTEPALTPPAPSDDTPPVITPSVSGTLGDNGWYTSDVNVSWGVSDAESDITSMSGCGVTTVDSDTDGVTFTCTSTSAGGTASESVTIKRDATSPVVSFAGNAGSYRVDQTVAITCSASDATSGLASSDCPGAAGNAYTFGLGSHTLSASATDAAGNAASASTTFSVTVSSESLCALVQRWVTQRGTANALCQQLRNGAIQGFQSLVRAQTGRHVPAAYAELLLTLSEGL